MPGEFIWACLNPEGARDSWVPVKVSADGKLLVDIAEMALDDGIATGGSNTTLIDTAKGWENNMWEDCVVEVSIGGVEYHRTITANTNDRLTFNALPGGVVVAAGDVYQIRRGAVVPAGAVQIDDYTDATGANILPAAVRSTAITAFRAIKVQIHWAAVTSNPVTIALDANAGVVYDTVLRIVTLGLNQDMVYYFPESALFEAGDVITVAWTNDIGVLAWGVQIGFME